jgi:hypothetical protein
MMFGLLSEHEVLNQYQYLKCSRFRFPPIATNKLAPVARMLLAVMPPVQKHRNALMNHVYSNVRSEINNLNLTNVAWFRWRIVH